jgi:uncharacterized protein (TIGR02452 family)
VYFGPGGQEISIAASVTAAVAAKRSIAPDDALPPAAAKSFPSTRIDVANLTTLQASRRLADQGLRPLALNFANGLHTGGGFLSGSLAQEEVLCRSSALYLTLVGDPMYAFHAQRPEPDSSAWCILSPDVPVFRTDNGTPLDEPWLLSVITCAAPVAKRIGMDRSAELLRLRIHRVLSIARSYGYESLVLGAWGCGDFGNDPHRTAADFKEALDSEFAGAFANITFAITDWSKERRFLGPFREMVSLPPHGPKIPGSGIDNITHKKQTDTNSTELLESQFHSILAKLGLESLPFEAAAQFFERQVNIGGAHYHRPGEVFNFEIGVPISHNDCLMLLDAVVAPFAHQFSCGLARTVSLSTQTEVEQFYRRLGIAMAAGNLAWEILHRQSQLKSMD